MFSLFSQRTARTAYLSTSRSVTAKGASRLQTREQLPRCPIRLTSHQFSSSSPQHARYSRFSSSSDEQKSWGVSLETRLAAVGAGCAALYIVFHLERVPETGRLRFMSVSPESEKKLGEKTYQQVLASYKGHILPSNHPVTQEIHEITTRILDANNLGYVRSTGQESPQYPKSAPVEIFSQMEDLWDPDTEKEKGSSSQALTQREWNLIVVGDNKITNAMAFPGSIVVFTGILPVCGTKDGLAAVLGHEIGHVVARHVAEKYSYGQVVFAAAMLLDFFQIPLSSMLVTLLMELPHSRKQEHEADAIGLRLSSKACFDPRAAPEFFVRIDRLEKSSKNFSTEFLSTHPMSQTRVRSLIEQLPNAYALQAASSACGDLQDHIPNFKSVSSKY